MIFLTFIWKSGNQKYIDSESLSYKRLMTPELDNVPKTPSAVTLQCPTNKIQL